MSGSWTQRHQCSGGERSLLGFLPPHRNPASQLSASAEPKGILVILIKLIFSARSINHCLNSISGWVLGSPAVSVTFYFLWHWPVKKMKWCMSHPWLRMAALQREKVRNEALKGSTVLPLEVTGNTIADFSGSKQDERTWNQNIHVPKPLKPKDFIRAVGTAQDKANGIKNALWREHSFSYSLLAAVSQSFPFWGTGKPVQLSKPKCRSQITVLIIWFYLSCTSGFPLSEGRRFCDGM